MARHVSSAQLVWVLLSTCVLIALGATAADKNKWMEKEEQRVEVVKHLAVGDWDQGNTDLALIDATIIPDYWGGHGVDAVDPRVRTNAAEPPEQLVKVTDRRHKFPVFATICSISVLVTVITLLIVCTS